MNYDELFKSLIEDEGMRLKPYKCTAGKLTIGIGRNIEDNGITEEEASYLLSNDINRCDDELTEIFGCQFDDAPIDGHIDEHVVPVLINMIFNLGKPRFMKFKKMIKAIKKGDWDKAADEMLDSKWAVQVGARSLRLARIMRMG